MSRKVREWLTRLRLMARTSHEDRVAIDKEIERRTGVYCDYALEKGLITEREFKEIVQRILAQHKERLSKTVDRLVEEGIVV